MRMPRHLQGSVASDTIESSMQLPASDQEREQSTETPDLRALSHICHITTSHPAFDTRIAYLGADLIYVKRHHCWSERKRGEQT